jgi:hypothetical protein
MRTHYNGGSNLHQQIRSLSFACSFMALSGALLYAQGTSGNISGQVLDPSGLRIPGVRVTATKRQPT